VDKVGALEGVCERAVMVFRGGVVRFTAVVSIAFR
jgi:hypothetical protein